MCIYLTLLTNWCLFLYNDNENEDNDDDSNKQYYVISVVVLVVCNDTMIFLDDEFNTKQNESRE